MIVDYMGMNLKRKELEEINDDFSDIFLASPARKIRRLDAELPPIIEEEEAEIPLGMERSTVPNRMSDQLKPLDTEELPLVPDIEDKAIVLFKPMNSQLFCSYSVDPNLISSFKNQVFLGSHLNASRPNEDENRDNAEGNTCRAVIPWVPSHQLDQKPAVLVSQTEVSEAMDNAEEMDATTMDIDDDDADASDVGQQAAESINHSRINEGLQCQWQQQHCMIPQPPQHITNPIMWYR